MRKLPPVEVKTEFIPFAGGFDVVTPALSVPSGYLREAQNYEHNINGGYDSITGYERFDGRVRPSDALYSVLAVSITGTVVVGDVLTDNAGTSFGTVIALPAGQAVLTKVTGTFSTGNIKVGATVVGTCTGAQTSGGASTSDLNAQYLNLAADEYRDDIAAVPGSGSILGVWSYNDIVYAFRNNAGGTAVDMYKSSSSGWVQVALGRELRFTSGGATEIAVGNVITGATSGATATITGITLESGTWAAGTAGGRFIFASQTGTFQAENINVGASPNLATIAGNSSAITFAIPSGRFSFVNENFGGGANTKKMYGCDGKNRGFQFDGTTFIPIVTGMTADTPEHIFAHKNQLFFSFIGSVQHSAPGAPFAWSAITGAAELAMGDTVTGFKDQPGSESGGALSIFTRNSIGILYGSGVADWNLVTYKREAGAIAYSSQNIGATIMFDDRGITGLAASQAFGNFTDATLSRRIQTWLKDKRTKVNESCIVRDKNQYRLFFSDRYAIYATFDNKKLLGLMPVLFAHVVKCACSTEMNDGSESIFFGSDNGFVYQMEKGTSFDGDAIEAYIHLAFDSLKSPRINKRFRGITFEVAGVGYAEFDFSYELGYGTTEIDQPASATVETSFSPATWDSFTWDAFVWDGRTLLPADCDMTGTAENVSIVIRSNSDYFSPLKFSGALIDYTQRRKLR